MQYVGEGIILLRDTRTAQAFHILVERIPVHSSWGGTRTAQAPPPFPTQPLSLQMYRVEGIIADVCSKCLQFCFVADDMIVKTFLPEMHSTDIAQGSEIAQSGPGCE